MVAGSPGPAQLPAELGGDLSGAPLALMTGVPPRRRAALGVTHERIIEKPFELETLIDTVHGMLARRRCHEDRAPARPTSPRRRARAAGERRARARDR